MTSTLKQERITALKQALSSDDQSVRFNAGLDLVKNDDVDGVPALIEAFTHESGVVRLFHAGRTLAAFGSAAVPALEAALASSNPQVRVNAAYTLAKIDPARAADLVPVAMEVLKDEDTETISDALRFLGEVGPAAQRAVPDLIAVLGAPHTLEDPQSWVVDPRASVAMLLAQIAEPASSIVDALTAALDAPDPSTRWGAARGLGELGGAAQPAWARLAALVGDEAEIEMVRIEAAYTLGATGDASETASVLLNALRSRDWWVQVFAAQLLGEAGAPPVQVEEQYASSLDRSFLAMRTIQRLDDPSSVVLALIQALSDPNGNVRRNAAYGLSRIAERDGNLAVAAIPALIDALTARDLGPVAAEALARMGVDAEPALRAALDGEAQLQRRHAAYALTLIATPEALEAVEAAEQVRPIERLRPGPEHFYLQVPVVLDEAKQAAFEALYRETLAKGAVGSVDYHLPYPKHEFLRYLVEHRGVLVHGSKHTDLDILKPLRWSTDGADSGNVSGVYADKDWIRPIYFGVVDRKRCFGLNNGFFDLNEDGEIIRDETQGYSRRFYKLTVGVTGLPRSPWQNAMVYILPPDTFEFWNEWTSRSPVVPLMKLPVEPDDLPIRDEVWGANWRAGGALWVMPDEPFPFLRDVLTTPIRLSEIPPWIRNEQQNAPNV